MKMYFRVAETDDMYQNKQSTDSSFRFLFQRAVLLGLKEVGYLNEMQYRDAESELLRQYRDGLHTEQR